MFRSSSSPSRYPSMSSSSSSSSRVVSSILSPLIWLCREFGVFSVWDTGRDAWLIILSRSCRMFAYGANSLIIAVFFSALSFSDRQIGLFFTLTLLGDLALGFGLTMVADRVGRRRVLAGGAMLMVASGATFVLAENFWVLLLAAVVGVISATGSDFGPFRAVEESTLSHLTGPATRSDVLSWYVTSSAVGSALGTELSGRAVEYLKGRKGWDIKDAYHAIFWLYVVAGGLCMLFAFSMSDACEADKEESGEEKAVETATAAEGLLEEERQRGINGGDDDDDASPSPSPRTRPVSTQTTPTLAKPRSGYKSLIAQIAPDTRSIMYKLWLLLTVDSLADGIVSLSLTTYYMDGKFASSGALTKSTLGDIMSASYFLAAASTAFASPLARRLGLVNTMVFTHLPSSATVLLFPLPSSLPASVALLMVRRGLNNMDQAPRAALIAAVVRPAERTAVMGVTGMLRTLASALGPSVTGFLAQADAFWVAFVAAGALRIAYDLGLWALFVNVKLHAHETGDTGEEAVGDYRRVPDEEMEVTEMAELRPVEQAK